jgi:hypothetical protein
MEAELNHLLGKGGQAFGVIADWLERARDSLKSDRR